MTSFNNSLYSYTQTIYIFNHHILCTQFIIISETELDEKCLNTLYYLIMAEIEYIDIYRLK